MKIKNLNNSDMKKIIASGKRKRAIAIASIIKGSGEIRINKKDYRTLQKFNLLKIDEPIRIAQNVLGKINFNVSIKVRGGGEKSQIEAARLSLAKAIIEYREKREISTTNQLAEIVENSIFSHRQLKAKARIFQALRIFVNRELEILKSTITDAIKILNFGGRIVVISYHSLEDRIIKNIFRYEEKNCVCHPEILKCICNKKSNLKIIIKKPVIPTQLEIEKNNRARSAKMRVAEKKEVL